MQAYNIILAFALGVLLSFVLCFFLFLWYKRATAGLLLEWAKLAKVKKQNRLDELVNREIEESFLPRSDKLEAQLYEQKHSSGQSE